MVWQLDMQVLSNTLAETRAPAGLAGAPSGVSGTMSRAPTKRQRSRRADDDDTVTVNGGGGPAADGRQQKAALPAQHATTIVPDPQPGSVPDGAGVIAAANPDEVAAKTAPGVNRTLNEREQLDGQRPASPSRGGTGAEGEGYPASWARQEIVAHKAGDMALLSALQVRGQFAEPMQPCTPAVAYSGRSVHCAAQFHSAGWGLLIDILPHLQPKATPRP